MFKLRPLEGIEAFSKQVACLNLTPSQISVLRKLILSLDVEIEYVFNVFQSWKEPYIDTVTEVEIQGYLLQYLSKFDNKEETLIYDGVSDEFFIGYIWEFEELELSEE